MLLPELPRGDLIPFFERTDQVAAVCKAGLGGNKVQVIIGKEEQVLDLVPVSYTHLTLPTKLEV
mgnify:CR=1 FL=1